MSARLAILTYHSIDETGSVLSTHPETFALQMAELAEAGYRGMSLRAALAQAREQGGWPERTVVLTFDDGYENNLRLAQPVLARHGFTATLYVITGHVGGANDWEEPPPGFGRQSTLDWAQVGELANAGWEIGAHTRSHRDLRRLEDDVVAEEILGSREDIEQRLGGGVETFAYPRGLVSPTAARIVAGAFGAGCTTVLRRARWGGIRSLLPRVDAYYLRRRGALTGVADGRLDGWLSWRRMGRRVRAALRRGG